jgi:hypothetical protein
MSEGDYPFPSTYITYSVGPGLIPLPAWPLRVACGKGAGDDHGVVFAGADLSMDEGYPTSQSLKYSVTMGGGGSEGGRDTSARASARYFVAEWALIDDVWIGLYACCCG